MNRIEKLIQELCPEGVPLSKIDDHIDYEQPTKYIVSTTNYADEYETPVLTAGQTFLLGYTDENEGIFEASPEFPVIIFDDFTTAFKWVDFRFKVKSSAMKILRTKEGSKLDLRFLFHYMGVLNFAASEHARHWISVYSQFQMPTPPIRIQQEIVSILDKFTELEAELEAELEGRTSLFETLRAKLFDEASAVSRVELGSICDMYSGEFVKKDRQGNDFLYPVYNGGSEPTGFYSEFNSPENSIVIASRGSIGSVSFVTTPFWAGNSCFVLRNPLEEVNYRYLYHYLKHSESELYKLRAVGTIPALNLRPLLKFEVPIPDPLRQERISSILDKFEQLESDITFGLPAEIEARRKQYEYYRNKLLTFKELDAA